MKPADVSGQKFNRLTAIEPTGGRVANKIMWRCMCDCGSIAVANVAQLRNGQRTSCGCAKLSGKQIRKKAPEHGHCVNGMNTATYRVWTGMLTRCRNKNDNGFRHYGARGISVCARWNEFANFLADMGERPAGMSLDRIDNDGNYCKENCRWATDIEQHRNRSDNTFFEFDGHRATIAEWGERIGIDPRVLASRVRRQKWPIEKALTTPMQTKQQIAAATNLKRWGWRPQEGKS